MNKAQLGAVLLKVPNVVVLVVGSSPCSADRVLGLGTVIVIGVGGIGLGATLGGNLLCMTRRLTRTLCNGAVRGLTTGIGRGSVILLLKLVNVLSRLLLLEDLLINVTNLLLLPLVAIRLSSFVTLSRRLLGLNLLLLVDILIELDGGRSTIGAEGGAARIRCNVGPRWLRRRGLVLIVRPTDAAGRFRVIIGAVGR